MTNLQILIFAGGVLFSFFVLWFFIKLYNKLIELNKNVHLAFSNINLLMKQRHDELPKLIDSCRMYMKYEKDTLTKIVKLRNLLFDAMDQKEIKQLGQLEHSLQSSIGKLFALAENYPELKTNTLFIQLQTRISFLESAIKDQREIYNQRVTENNIGVTIFPDNLAALIFGFKEFVLLEFVSSELNDVDINDRFNQYKVV